MSSSHKIPIEIFPVPPGVIPSSNPSPAESEQVRVHRIQFYKAAIDFKKKETSSNKHRQHQYPDIDFKFPEAADSDTVKKIINNYFDPLPPQECNFLLGDKVLSRKRYNFTIDVILNCGEGCNGMAGAGRDGLNAAELRTYLRKNSPFTTKVDSILREATGKYVVRVAENRYVLYKTPKPSKKYGTSTDLLRVIQGNYSSVLFFLLLLYIFHHLISPICDNFLYSYYSVDELYDLSKYHHELTGCLGVQRTKNQVRDSVDMPVYAITAYRKTCFSCQAIIPQPIPRHHSGTNNPIKSDGFRDRFQYDLVDMRTNPCKNHLDVEMNYIGHLRDHFTGFSCFHALPDRSPLHSGPEVAREFGVIGYSLIFQSGKKQLTIDSTIIILHLILF